MVKVSVIVPVYNVEKYLPQCLDSLVNQTLKDIEIIIVNDGSPDNSQKIIDKYQKRYPKKIKSYIKENGGQGSARNFGLKYVTGKYISFVDSDDWLKLNALEDMYCKAIKNNADIVICDMIEHYENGSAKYYDFTNFNSIYESTPSACNKIFKKDVVKNINFIEGLWYEDFNFTIKILLGNPKIITIKKGYYNYNYREKSTMHNNNSLKNLDIIKVMNDLKDYAIKNKLYNKEIFSYLIFNHILIDSINRVVQQKSNEKRYVIKELRLYCHNNISNYKSQKYYKNISFNRKIIASLNYLGLHNISKLLLNIKAKING